VKSKVSLFAFIAILAMNAHLSAFQIEGVPFVRQQSARCGPASLSSVLSYYGAEIDPGAIASATYDERLGGSLITDLENFAKKRGFKTESGQGDIEKIKDLIDKKIRSSSSWILASGLSQNPITSSYSATPPKVSWFTMV